MPDDFKEEKPRKEVSESGASETDSPALSDTGRSSVDGTLAQVQYERVRLGREMRADADALGEKFGPPPPYINQDNAEGTSEWVDRGIQDVPVADLPQPEGVTSENFDHHITHDDALNATREYQAMRPLIDEGYTGEDFADRDRAAGLDYEHGQQRIYDLFHGSSPIHVTKDGDQYDIIDGRHRIFAAKELGMESIPAHVKEKVSS